MESKSTRSQLEDVRQSYDQVASEFVGRIFRELEGKPQDRELLDHFLATVDERGPICDIGCGPGQIARYLFDRGFKDVSGIDLSPEMIKEAKKLSPDIRFEQGNMLDLKMSDDSLGGITAFYSIIHLLPENIESCFEEFHRVLRPGGIALITFHMGTEVVHLDEWWGKKVSIDFHFLKKEDIETLLRKSGFNILYSIERDPYPPEIEVQSRRAYILAKKSEVDSSDSGRSLRSLAVQYERQLAWRDWETALSRCPISKGQSVLDLGCGPGDMTQELCRRGAAVTAVDCDPDLLSVARSKNPLGCRFFQQDLRSLQLGDQKYDGLWCSFTAAYFVDFDEVFAGWLPLLKDKAWICITEVDDLLGHAPLSTRYKEKIESFYKEAQESRRYDFLMGRKIRPILESHGFEVTTIDLKDKELAFDGPASSEVIQAWSDRLERMGGLKAYLGSDLLPFRDEWLSTLSVTEHRSNCRVVCCVGR